MWEDTCHEGNFSRTSSILHVPEIRYHIKLHTEKLEQNADFHNHNTYQNLNLSFQFYRTDIYKKGLMNTGFKLYNK
jgi:hypothetical protein